MEYVSSGLSKLHYIIWYDVIVIGEFITVNNIQTYMASKMTPNDILSKYQVRKMDNMYKQAAIMVWKRLHGSY
jgi:hypothetical protein